MIGDRGKRSLAYPLRLRNRGDISAELIVWEILHKRLVCCDGEEAIVLVEGAQGADRGATLVMMDVHQLGAPVTDIA
jgi:hypothetical protein